MHWQENAFVPSTDASVLAIHRRSQTLHVDDTLNWEPLPWGARLAFHLSLRFVLQSRAGAATDFRVWATELITAGANPCATSAQPTWQPSEL